MTNHAGYFSTSKTIKSKLVGLKNNNGIQLNTDNTTTQTHCHINSINKETSR